MFEERQIRDLNQRSFSYADFVESVERHDEEGYELYIGTDSQVHRGKIHIATAVAFVRPSTRDLSQCSGGVFYVKDKILRKDYPNLRMRMMLEAYRSIEVAMEVEQLFSGIIHVHLDIGPNPRKSKTSAFKLELTGLVKGQGYEVAIKPDAWCASGVADRMCR
jgi:uncharacterized protein